MHKFKFQQAYIFALNDAPVCRASWGNNRLFLCKDDRTGEMALWDRFVGQSGSWNLTDEDLNAADWVRWTEARGQFDLLWTEQIEQSKIENFDEKEYHAWREIIEINPVVYMGPIQ